MKGKEKEMKTSGFAKILLIYVRDNRIRDFFKTALHKVNFKVRELFQTPREGLIIKRMV